MPDKPLTMERMLNAPVAKVWAAFTDENKLKQWTPFIPKFKAEVGFKFRFSLGPDPQHQFLHLCEVTEAIPEKKLAYSWRYDGYEGESLLAYEFIDEDGKTRVKMTWSGLETFPEIFKQAGFEEGSVHQFNALREFVEK